MVDYDDIANRSLASSETGELMEIFTCEQDGYTVYYTRGRETATYHFGDSRTDVELGHLTEGQVDYFLSSGYWTKA